MMKNPCLFPASRLIVPLFVLLPLLLSGCASVPDTGNKSPAITSLTAENTGDFGPRPAIPTAQDIHRLTPEQADNFLRYMNDPRFENVKANRRLYDYLEHVTADFAYEGKTFTASETLGSGSGNCMSLAVLTTALADLAGVEIDYQLMDDDPVFEFNGTMVKKGLHIRTILYDPDYLEVKGALLISKPGFVIDYFPTNRQRFFGNLDRYDYLAMYFQNMAVEALDAGNLNLAYWNAMESLHYVPDYSQAINTLAVLNRRAGHPETAEAIYQYGIAHAEEKLSLLKNYRVLLEDSGRIEEARRIQQKLDTMDDPSPYHWYRLAQTSYADGEYRQAIRYYHHALDRASYLHEAWLGIARANYEMGRLRQTRQALKAALDQAEKVSAKNLYQAKLMALSRETGG